MVRVTPDAGAAERTSPAAALVIIASVVINAAFILGSGGTRDYPRGQAFALAAMVLPLLALLTRDAHAVAASLCLGLWAAYYVLGGPLIWPLYLLLPLLAFALVSWRVPALRGTLTWLRRGRITRITLAWTVASAVTAGVALALWFFLLAPPLENALGMLPKVSAPLLLVGMLLFSCGNALLEEVLWRGVLQEALHAALGNVWLAIALQGLSFGVAHFGGFPRGAIGVAMATSYGVMMGVIRKQSGGLLAPLLSHVFADCVIFSLMLSLRE
jgi:uncharacterized protein